MTDEHAPPPDASRHGRLDLGPRLGAGAHGTTQGIIVHRRMRPLYANQPAARLLGFDDASEIVALPCLDGLFVPGEAKRIHEMGVARRRGDDLPSVYDLNALRRDGTPIVIQAMTCPIDWQGEHAVMAQFTDVTEIRQAEREARRTERLLRAVLNNSPVVLWSIDAEGIITLSEGREMRTLGLEPGSAVGRSVFEVFDYNPELLALVRRALAGESFAGEVGPAGSAIFERTFQPVYGSSGEIEGVIGVSVNVTQSATAERRARESERLLRSVIDALPHFVFLKDRDRRFQLVNESFARRHGKRVEDMVGLRAGDLPLRPAQSDKEFADDDRRVLETGEVVLRSGYEARTADGELADFDTMKLPLRDDSGTVVGVVGVVDNVTEVRRTQRELQRYRDHLEELVEERTAELVTAQDELMRSARLATIGQLTATVSHELRNPLGTIRASFDTLRMQIGDVGEARMSRLVERIDRNIDRCVTIIEELLDYTRKPSLDLVAVALDDWLAEALADVDAPDGIALEVRSDSGATVLIDLDRMRRALVNLTQNAFQSLVEAEPHAGGRVSITTTCDDGHVSVHVHDTGPGVAPEARARIFEPLFSTRSFGVGLGLPLVRTIAEQHGGEVVHAAPDAPAGSSFTLRMPIAR